MMPKWTTLPYVVSKNKVVYRGHPPTSHPLIVVRKTADPTKAQFALPYNLKGWQLANQLGLEFPDPEEFTFDWASRQLFASQIETAKFLFRHPRAFVLSEMGTGKTRATLTALALLKTKCERQGRPFLALILAPLSTLEVVWASEARTAYLDYFTSVVLQGPSTKKRKLLDQTRDFANLLVTNHDAVLNMYDDFFKLNLTAIVIDEITVFRNAHTERWRIVNALLNSQRFKFRAAPPPAYAWGLTGTPIPNLPTDAWGQKKLLMPDQAGSFAELEVRTVIPLNRVSVGDGSKKITTKWKIRAGAAKYIYKYLQPAIRFTRSDVYELPEETTTQRSAQLTAEQKKLMKILRGQARVEYNQRTVTVANAAVYVNKALQIASGVLIDDQRMAHHLDVPDRLGVVQEVVEQADGKVLIFANYRASVIRIAEFLSSNYGVEVVHGDVSADDRARIFTKFQQDTDELRVIVAHPKTMSHGVTLTAANTILWFGPVWSAELYEQANARIARASQTRNRLIVQLHSSLLEKQVFELLARRRSLQAEVLGLFEKFLLTE